MTMPCLIDSNVLIDYLNCSVSVPLVENFERALAAGSVVSVITTMELLGWRGHTQQSRTDAENLLRSMGEIFISPQIVNQVIKLRSEITIKLPDAIIAASALVEGLSLMTHNTEDFKAISGLVLIDPYCHHA